MDVVRHRSSALRLLHYWWPLLMGYSLTVVVHKAIERPLDAVGLGAFLAGIAAVYSLDRVIDPPRRANPEWLTRTLAVVGLATALMCVAFLTRLPLWRSAIGVALASASLLYPTLKRFPFLKTVAVAVAWTWAAAALPFDDGSFLGWRFALVPVSWSIFLLVAAGCLLCDLKDAESDRLSSVRSLPVLYGPTATAILAGAIALAGGGVALALDRPALAIAGLCLGAVSLFPRLLSSDASGPLLVDILLTLPGFLIAAHVL